MKSQILSKQRLAGTSLLAVLFASTALGQASNVRVDGAFDGRLTAVVQGGTLLGNPGMNLTGTASYIGRFTITQKGDLTDLATGLTTGGAVQLVAANSKLFTTDSINGVSVGRSGDPTDTPNLGHGVILVTITGGTGRFQGATGVLTMDFLVDNTTIPAYVSISGTLTGTISVPVPAK